MPATTMDIIENNESNSKNISNKNNNSDIRNRPDQIIDASKCGRDFECYIAMLFILRGVVHNYQFLVGVEIPEAMKFDDLVFIYKENDRDYFRCLQAKHTTSPKKNIDLNSLVTVADSNFSLVKYYFSYKDLIHEDFFKGKINKDLLVYTNIKLNLNGIIGQKSVNEKTWSLLESIDKKSSEKKRKNTLNDLVTLIEEEDNILDVKTDKNRYRFNEIIIPTIRPNINKYNLNRVARRLLDWLMGKKTFCQIEHVVRPYWEFLTKHILDIEKKGFFDSFLINSNTTKVTCRLEDFRQIFMKELDSKNKTLLNATNLNNNTIVTSITLNDLNVLLQKEIPEIEKYIQDWNTITDVDFDDVINEVEIGEFLNRCVFASNQPNYEDLKNIIHSDIIEIQRERLKDDIDFYTESDIIRYGEDILHNLYTNIEEWKAFKGYGKFEERFKTKVKCKELLENRWNEIQFGVKETVESFTGRDDELEDLHKKIRRGRTVQSQTTVICGLPGMGKTELVRGYIQKHSQRFENIVLWIDGKSQDSMEDSFRRLAKDELKIATTDDIGKLIPIKDLVNEIYKKFIGKKCLFIFDDVKSQEALENFIPHSTTEGNHPFIIITSCSSQWNLEQKQELDVLSNQGAVKLITNQLRLADHSMYKDVEALADILGCFPLAVQQATAYISFKANTSIKFSIADYIEAFKKNAQELLSYTLPKEMNSYEKTTYDNFKNIIEALMNRDVFGNNSIKVIGVMSHLAPDNIRVKWFSKYTTEELGHIVELLKEYSIVKIKSSYMSIHKLVQLVTKITLRQFKWDLDIIHDTYEFLHCNYPYKSNSMDDYEKKRELMPHIEAFISNLDEKCDWSSEEIDTIKIRDMYLENALMWLNDILRVIDPKKRKKVLERLIQLVQTKYGESSIEVGYLLRDINEVHYHLGNYEKQKAVLERAMSIFEMHRGAESIETLSVLFFVGIMHKNIGEHDRATEIFQKILSKYLEFYGEKHIATGRVFQQMAILQRYFGNFLESRNLMSQALVAYKNEFGPKHLETAVIEANLGIIEKNLGDYARTRELFKFALSSFQLYLNPENIRISAMLNNVALLESDLGNYCLAKKLLEQALKTTQQQFGMDHSKTSTVFDSLSTVERKLGNYSRAKSLSEKAIKNRLTNFPPNHIRVAPIHHSLGTVEKELGNLSQAKQILEMALSIYELKYSRTNIKTVAVLNDLANVEAELGNYQKAKELLDIGVSVRVKNYGLKHFHTATVFNSLGAVEINLGNYSQARELLDKALSIRTLQFGPDHILTAEVLLNLGILNKKQFLYNDSKQQLEQALAIYEKHYGSSHLRTSSPLHHLGDLQVTLGDLNKAKKLLVRALKPFKNDTESENINTARILFSLCAIQMKLENYHEAMKLITKSLNLYECHVSVAPSEVAQVAYTLGEIQSKFQSIQSLGL
ncbi:uncharacterized protein LOC143913639 [Arctopsyche grandis]|uniref:uncharacterized protein LOC143913639 n=1 Tax=Arctopsyche grandis TaxID=121162 RepID=UPI00406DA014